MSVTSVWYRKVLLAASCLLLPACLNLDLPELPADGGVGPTLTVTSPLEGETIALNAPVSVDAVSVNGVASVTVTCGGAPSTGVFTWNVPPYTGVVDFTRCTLVTSGVADSGVGQLQLTFIGVDQLGHVSTKAVSVLLDTTTASLSAVLPERVAPLAPLDLTVGSDRPLLLPPTVRLAGREADGIVQRANPDGGAPFYDVTFLQAPGLGIDNYSGDPFDVPFEVLVDVERSVGLTVDARATNGNASHLEQAVLLSRVLWDRIVPGRIAIDAAEPAATSRGIQVALAKATVVNATSDWLPGFFRASDGTYVAFDPNGIVVSAQPLPDPDAGSRDAGTILNHAGVANGVAVLDAGPFPFPVDAGFVAADFDARGHVLFTRPSLSQRLGSDVIALGEPVNGPRPATGYSVPFFLDALQTDGGVTGPPLTRMDDLVCPPDVLTGNQAGCYFGAATHEVDCLQAATGKVVMALGTSSTVPLAPPVPGGTAGAFNAVRTYLSPNDVGASCGPAWTFFSFPQNGFVLQLQSDPALAGCIVQSVTRLLPVVDGSYALGVTVDCSGGLGIFSYQVLRVGPTGTLAGSYLAKAGLSLASQPLALGALQGGTFSAGASALGAVVTMRNDPPYTTFEAWLPDGAGPAATARVPGLYVYGSTTARLGKNVRSATDGSLSVLLNSATLGDVVLHFGPGLTPRWLYRYPRLAQNSSLIGGVDQGTVYYVDPFNNDIVALKRF
ncbi:MAG TPA: hypothetical protein VMT11_07595 [Myxococcaceae bacterium]|nr:hypothetical protein [Myxococcaceae bacterium]